MSVPCAHPAPPGSRFCPQCGVALQAVRSPSAPFGDRRVVTVLCTDISGFTSFSERADPAVLMELVNQLFEEQVGHVYRLGGVVDCYVGDAIVAVFGAPVAHEDDPERAVRAALAMREGAAAFARRVEAELGVALRLRIGVHTGVVVAGEVGGAQKRDYTVLGETVKRAQRMEAGARAGEVLVSPETHRLVASRFEFVSREPQGFELVAARVPGAEQPARAAFVGRAIELERLAAAVRQAMGGAPVVVRLTGPAGSGKTALVQELLARSGGFFKRVIGRVASYEADTPFAFLHELIRHWLHVPRFELEALRATLQARLPRDGDGPRAVALLLGLCGFELEAALIAGLEPDRRVELAFRTLTALLLEESRHLPLVLELEDLQWLDPMSRRWLQGFLQALAEAGPGARVLVLLQARALELARPAGLDGQELELPCLSPDEGSELVTRALELTGAQDERLQAFLAGLVARAEGHPRYLLELARVVREQGALERREHGWGVRPGVNVQLPASLGAALGARLDALPLAVREVVQLGAVLGRRFPLLLVEWIIGTSQVRARLEEACSLGVLRHEAGDSFSFVEGMFQEAAYEALLRARRRELHREAVVALEEVGGGGGEELAERLRHSVGADDGERIARYAYQAAQVALQGWAGEAALQYVKLAEEQLGRLDAVPDGLDACELRLLAAEAWTQQATYAEAGTAAVAALGLATTAAQRARALGARGLALERSGAFAEALEAHAQACAEVADQPGALQGKLLVGMAWAKARLGAPDAALAICDAALLQLDPARDRRELSLARAMRGHAYYRLGQYREAVAENQLALALREQLQDLWGVASSQNNLAFLENELGNVTGAVEQFEASLAFYRKVGDRSSMAVVRCNLGELLGRLGRLEEAEEHLRSSEELHEQIGHAAAAAVLSCSLGWVLGMQGRFDAAREALARGLAVLEAHDAVEYLDESRIYQASVLLEADDPGAREPIMQLQGCAHPVFRAVGDRLASQAAWKQGELERARTLAAAALAALEDQPAPLERARARAWLGTVLGEAALREQARAEFQGLEALWDLARLDGGPHGA